MLGFGLRMMSRNQALKLSRILGTLAFDLLRIRRGLVLKNLSLTFPEKNSLEIQGLARQVYQNQVLNIVELLRIPLIQNREDALQLVSMDADEEFQQVIQQNSGAVVVSGHLSSWEIIGVCTGLILKPMHFIVKPMRNQYLNDHLNHLRTLRGNKIITSDKALREGIRALKEGEVVVVLADQSQRKVDRHISFLGRRTSVFLGPAFLALKAGVPLFVEVSRRTRDNTYQLEIVQVKTSDLACCKDDIAELVRRYHQVLEEFIRDHPQEWLWLHNRWKRSSRISS